MTATVGGIHLSGTHTARPGAAGPPAGSLYSCTDHSLIYRTDGTSWSTWATLGGGSGDVATDAIWDAAGDLAVGSGANTAARLAIGASNGMVLARVANAVAWESQGGRLLAYKVDTTGDNTTSSATMADVDATNLAVTFTVPASGGVLVRLTAVCDASSTASAFQSWGLREGTSDIAGPAIATRQPAASTAQIGARSMVFPFTGLTPGDSLTYKWSYANSTGTGTLQATSAVPATMEVWSLP